MLWTIDENGVRRGAEITKRALANGVVIDVIVLGSDAPGAQVGLLPVQGPIKTPGRINEGAIGRTRSGLPKIDTRGDEEVLILCPNSDAKIRSQVGSIKSEHSIMSGINAAGSIQAAVYGVGIDWVDIQGHGRAIRTQNEWRWQPE